MKPGNLVYHIEDIKDAVPVPGLIIKMTDASVADLTVEAVVYFTDRVFGEYHPLTDLVRVEEYEGENE